MVRGTGLRKRAPPGVEGHVEAPACVWCVVGREAGGTIKKHITLRSLRLWTGPEGAEHVHGIAEGQREPHPQVWSPDKHLWHHRGLLGSQLHPNPLT